MSNEHRHVIVDAMNVIGSRPTGWWRDRDGAARTLIADLQRLAVEAPDALTAVLDGRPLADLPEGLHAGVAVCYARRSGRDAADDRIVELVRGESVPDSLLVVTSDRALAERVRAAGASVRGASWLLDRLGALTR